VVDVPTYCNRCILPDTRPGVRLDAEGVCDGCRNWDRKSDIDWGARAASFATIAQQAKERGADYDCLIPVSGGKDSYWQVHRCLASGLRPLCLTYRFPGRTELGQENLDGLRGLGVDHIDLAVSPRVEREFVRRAFLRTAIPGLVAHMGIYSAPIRFALKLGIPLVVYGENSAFEYGSEEEGLAGARVTREWLRTFGVTAGTTVEDWVGDGLTREELAAYRLPSEAELEAAGLAVLFLGYYFPWDPRGSLAVASAHGFRARAEGAAVGHLDFVNIDDRHIAVHHHPKWHKFGITRSWDTLSMEIRAGHLSRAEAIDALRELGDETPHAEIEAFCAWIGIEVADYHRTLEGFRDRRLWRREGSRWVVPDFLVPDFPWPADAPCLASV